MDKLNQNFDIISSNVKTVDKGKVNDSSPNIPGNFGVQLDVLCARDGQSVPLVVTQMCYYLCSSGGLLTEGIFKVSGSSRVMKNLRNAADCLISAEQEKLFFAHLQRYGDIHSVACLLKLFLQELPTGLVPPSHTKELLEVILY